MARLETVKGNTKCLFLPGNSIPVYCLDEREWILMDSGAKQDREELLSYLKEHHILVKAVLTSHAHSDHVGNHTVLKDHYGCELIMTWLDAGILDNSVSLKACFYSYTKTELETHLGEMVCAPDRVIGPDHRSIEIWGSRFDILALPGHAASHVGYVTPDGVAYLADSLVSAEVLMRSRLLYTLEWKTAIETMETVRQAEYSSYILAHYGICEDIIPVIDRNLEAFGTILRKFQRLSESEFTLEHMVRKVIRSMELKSGTCAKARLLERMIRSIMEYMVETGRLKIGIRDGLTVYRTK